MLLQERAVHQQENIMSPASAAQFMRIIAILSIVTGVSFALAVAADPTGSTDLFYHLVSSGDQGLGGIHTAEAKVTLAIAGGIFAGFSALLLFLVVPALEAYDKRMIRGTQISILIWFVIDSSASIASGNPANAAANIVFLILFQAPLLLVKAPAT
jgi:hypothetical protein